MRSTTEQTISDLTDELAWGGNAYAAAMGAAAHDRPRSLGAPLGSVVCRIQADVSPTYELHDGDATSLAPGTLVYLASSAKGDRFLVAMDEGGHWHWYPVGPDFDPSESAYPVTLTS